MTKFLFNARHERIEAKDGRKVAYSVPTGSLSAAAVEGILAGLDPEAATPESIAAAVEEASRRRGSVVPFDYRLRYGADQNCGDQMARDLTAIVTTPDGIDLDKARVIAAANGVEDRFDGWRAKGLNPGMVRMNLGNVLRGKLRREEAVTLQV